MVEPQETRVKSKEGEEKSVLQSSTKRNTVGETMQQNALIEMYWNYSGESSFL